MLGNKQFFCCFLIYSISLVALVSSESKATTFTSFSVVNQVEDAPYVVRGKIGEKWFALDDATKKPYTYWNFTVIEYLSIEKLPEDTIVIREAGGEVGNIGYRIPGSAEFNFGEDVIVLLRNADNGATKEIVGLMSGKYNIVKDQSGKEYIRSALSGSLRNAKGKLVSLEEFRDLVSRAQTHNATEEDQSIIINPMQANHSDHEMPESNIAASSNTNKADEKSNATTALVGSVKNENTPNMENSGQIGRQPAQKQDFSWFSISVVILFLFSSGFMLRLLLKKENA